ncbi:unnamed protein product, partial [Prorocentrum cordatum]
GRVLVHKGRFSKKWTAKALKARHSSAKRGSGGPESLEEVRGPLVGAMGPGIALAPDGARASHSAAEEIGAASLSGVNHQKKVFTPVTRLLKKQAGAETKLYFKLVAGDNSAESTQEHIKNTLRRVGNVGRHNTTELKKAVQTLSGAALLRRAGLTSVLDALRRYRVACTSGAVQMAPKGCFRAGLCKWAQ